MRGSTLVRFNILKVGMNSQLEKLFLLTFFIYYVLSFLFPQPNQFIMRITPLVLGVAAYIFLFLLVDPKIKKKDLTSLAMLTLFSLLASSYIILEKGITGALSMENLFFLSLPLFYITASRLSSEKDEVFVYKLFLYFIGFQFFVLLGQGMKMLTGVGFNTPAEYSAVSDQVDYANMLSGTFLNSNDLACLVMMIGVYFLLLKHYRGYRVGIGLGLICLILILTASRMSIFLFALSIFIFGLTKNRFSISNVLSIIFVSLPLLIITSMLFYGLISSFSDSIEAISRVKNRIDTIFTIFENGISSDNSMSVRFESYLNFTNNLMNLGYGTAKLRDYGIFVEHLGYKFSLLAVNPHSFIVEIGYWMGWPGLILFISFLFFLFMNKLSVFNFFVFMIFLLASMISSSAINNFFLFFSFFCCALMAGEETKKDISFSDKLSHVSKY